MTDERARQPGAPGESGEPAWIGAARGALDEHADRLPPGVETRLAAIREQALEPRRRSWPTWAGAATFAGLLVVALFIGQQSAPPSVPDTAGTDAGIEPGALEDLEVVEEMEFLAWMEAEGGADVAI